MEGVERLLRDVVSADVVFEGQVKLVVPGHQVKAGVSVNCVRVPQTSVLPATFGATSTINMNLQNYEMTAGITGSETGITPILLASLRTYRSLPLCERQWETNLKESLGKCHKLGLWFILANKCLADHNQSKILPNDWSLF